MGKKVRESQHLQLSKNAGKSKLTNVKKVRENQINVNKNVKYQTSKLIFALVKALKSLTFLHWLF